MLAHSESEAEETPSHLSLLWWEAILTPDLFLTQQYMWNMQEQKPFLELPFHPEPL